MPKIYSYLRFSSKKQADGDSVNRQLAKTRSFCDRKGYRLEDKTYQDLGLSGWKGKNRTIGALGAFLKAIDEGIIEPGDMLIVESTDRLTREEPMIAFGLFSQIVGSGITLTTLEPEAEYSPKHVQDNPYTLHQVLSGLIRGAEESSIKSKRVRSAFAMMRKTAKGKNGGVIRCWNPRWISVVEEKYVLNANAEIVRLIIKMKLKGIPCAEIAKTLNEKGKKPFGNSHKNREHLFSPAYIWQVLANPALFGSKWSRKEGKIIAEKYYPALVDEKTWWKLQCKPGIRGRKPKHVRSNVFRGLVFDGENIPLVVRSWGISKSHKKHGGAFYKSRHFSNDSGQGFSVEVFEKVFWDMVEPELLLKNTEDDGENGDKVKSLQLALAGIQRKKAEIVEAIQTKPLGGLVEALAGIEAKERELSLELEEQKKEIAAPISQSITAISSTIEKSNLNDEGTRQRLATELGRIVEKITIDVSGEKRTTRKLAKVVIYYRPIRQGAPRLTKAFEIESLAGRLVSVSKSKIKVAA